MITVKDKIVVTAPVTQGATTTKSGLFVPSTSEQAQFISSTVVAVGDVAASGGVTVGQVIHFNRLAAPKIAVNGAEFYVLRLDDVLAIEA